MPDTIHEFKVKNIDGEEVPLSRFRGKALLIVNTASKCGYTPQYQGLEALYRVYKPRGLEVLAFPSNDFGQQEPGSDPDIKAFCEQHYQTTFPLFAKISVTGPRAAPLFRFLVAQPDGGEVTWNFNKYLVDPDGRVVGHLDSDVPPASPELARQLEAILPQASRSGTAAPPAASPAGQP